MGIPDAAFDVDTWVQPWSQPYFARTLKTNLQTDYTQDIGAAITFPADTGMAAWAQPWSTPVRMVVQPRATTFPAQENWVLFEGFYAYLSATEPQDTLLFSVVHWGALSTFHGNMRVSYEDRTMVAMPRDDDGAIIINAENRVMTVPARTVIL
jgi:hypothetical protein